MGYFGVKPPFRLPANRKNLDSRNASIGDGFLCRSRSPSASISHQTRIAYVQSPLFPFFSFLLVLLNIFCSHLFFGFVTETLGFNSQKSEKIIANEQRKYTSSRSVWSSSVKSSFPFSLQISTHIFSFGKVRIVARYVELLNVQNLGPSNCSPSKLYSFGPALPACLHIPASSR